MVFRDREGTIRSCSTVMCDGAKCKREKDEDSIPDITEVFMNLMEDHARQFYRFYIRCHEESYSSAEFIFGTSEGWIGLYCEMEAQIETMKYFVQMVNDGMEWDIKLTDEYKSSSSFVFRGEIYKGEQLGNIHYGYVGSVLYPPIILHLGAGYNQITKGFHIEYLFTLFDEPGDYDMIDYGIKLYKEG